MEKNKEPMETEAQKGVEAATEKAPTRPVEAAGEDKPQSGTDAEEREDTGMDQGGETPPAGGERLSEDDKAFLKGMVEAARKVFASNSVQRLWFTADGCGFGNEADAADHAATLGSQTLTMIDRNDL